MTILTPDDIITGIEQLTLGGRSLQKVIGPSEVGISCQRCLARKLAETEKAAVVSSFRTTIGRAMHALLETELPGVLPEGSIIPEKRLFIHHYKSLTLLGNSDVYLPNEGHGMVLDYKVVGDDTLESTRRLVANNKPVKQQYVTQGHLYGYGYQLMGYPVEKICILYLPANKGDLRRYHVQYQYDYDQSKALEALAKVEKLIDRAEEEGWEKVIRSQSPESGCLSCPAYAMVDNPQLDLIRGFKKSK